MLQGVDTMKRVALLNAFLKAAATGDDLPTRFEILAYTGGILNVDGFDLGVVIDLQGLDTSTRIPVPIKHNTDDEFILGQTDEVDGIVNDGRTLNLYGDVTADANLSPSVNRVLVMARNGHQWQASIGAEVVECYDVPEGETITVNGQQLTGPFTLATRSVLRETSVLGMGADKNTRVVLAQLRGSTMSFEEWVASLGLDAATLTPEARAALMAQYEAMQQGGEVTAEGEDEEVTAEGEEEEVTAEGEEEDVAAEGEATEEGDKKPAQAKAGAKVTLKAGKKAKVQAGKPARKGVPVSTVSASFMAHRKQISAEFKRVNTIQAKWGSKDPKLVTAAIDNGWSVDKTELEFRRRQDRKQPPAGHVRAGNGSAMLQTLQAAMIIRAGGKLDHPGYSGILGLAFNLPSWLRAGINSDARQKVMESAWEFRDMSMVDLCRAACQIDGREPTQKGNQGYVQAAVSGGALADIFTTNINAVFLQKFAEAEDTTGGWTQDGEAQNFQPMERTRLLKGNRLSPHARGQEADHEDRSDAMETYKIARYSKQFAVDEMDIIDDRFNTFKDIPDEMGQACGRLRPDLCYSILLANAALSATTNNSTALFSASQPNSQSNLVASGGTLSSATLQAGMASMFNIMENGVGLNLYPTHFLGPMILCGTAFNLLQGQNIALAGTAGSVTEKGDLNPLFALQSKFGRIEVVSDSRLTNGVVDPVTGTTYSGSATTWRLVSNKGPTIEVAYRKGAGKAPQVRQYVLDKGKWGLGWDVNFDIGAKALAWQTFYEARA